MPVLPEGLLEIFLGQNQARVSVYTHLLTVVPNTFFLRMPSEVADNVEECFVELKVLDALKLQKKEDLVSISLKTVTQPERCPNSNCNAVFLVGIDCVDVHTLNLIYMQHHGGCSAMQCNTCLAHFCLYCRTIIKAAGQEKNANALAHDHVFDCRKRPEKNQILTDSVLFPADAEGDEDFVDCYLKTRKLHYLAQTVAGWSADDCRRLVLDPEFQSLLTHLKERQVR
jgi:hypothetical protein